ncbi:MAG: radical SAM family heme chaperone HemW, partial [Clostridia bacterium]|nr:radical SAM family heme chaperone HemW [Clostridia bacterium]
MEKIGIYVHIPFCKQKCKYCDFVSFQCKEAKYEDYFKCLIKEIVDKSDEIKDQIDTIYIGGGTPSIVPAKYIEEIIKAIKENYKVLKNAEITIEVNPGTVDEQKLTAYKEIGINRLSIGLQSTNDNLLKMLGRIHTYKEFEEVYQCARNVGFKNINVDLMIGLPNQTIKDVEESLNRIIEKSPEHISVYSLIVEEGTKMYDLINKGTLELTAEELERKMYWKVKSILEESGFNQYEISNFSKPKYESKHNMNCWNQHSYLGFGVAAHSYYDGMRYSNIINLDRYIENYKNEEAVYNIVFHEQQDKNDMMKEYMILGLRKLSGVKISEFKNKFVDNPLY